MNAETDHFLTWGAADPPPERTPLRAGPLTAIFEQGALRSIRLGRQDVLLMVYAAVRDHNWGTIPAALSDVQVYAAADSFDVRFTARHCQGEIDFAWQGTIRGYSDGTIQFDFDGQASTSFHRNRIGFCVLHPHTCAGLPCQVEHASGPPEDGQFPERIAPHQPFEDITAITHPLGPSLRARVSFTGDVFEMEDQRNWTDSSFKTYCTPLALPFPVQIAAGERVRQSVRLELLGSPIAEPAQLSMDGAVTISFTGPSTQMPSVGLGLPAAQPPLSATELARLRALELAHLRVDLHPARPGSREQLFEAAEIARGISTPLEIALHLGPEPESAARTAARWAQASGADVVRWLVFSESALTTPLSAAQAARQALASFGRPIGGGTDGFFTQLNRERPPVSALDFVAYSLNPQVHAFDHASLVETLPGQAETVASARAFSGGLPVHVGPVTLKMRWNPSATGPPAPPPPGELPPEVDPRQMALFGAAWTLGSIKALSEAGAAALTYYALTGWLGIMESEAGSPLPELFPSIPGAVFPMYHVFAALAGFRTGQVSAAHSTDPLQVEGLLLADGPRRRLLLANYTAGPVRARLPDIRRPVTVRVLDQGSVHQAGQDPLGFRGLPGQALAPGNSGLELALGPCALLQMDWDH